MRARGFLLGGTAGRTTLNGEGLQHEDGHSHVLAAVIPNCVSYDPTFSYEVAVIVQDGLRRMFAEQEDVFYYITLMNENYEHPALPEGAEAGILKGMYLLCSDGGRRGVEQARRAVAAAGQRHHPARGDRRRRPAGRDYGVVADIWSAPSFTELRREGLEAERWNMLHPTEPPRRSHVETCLADRPGPVVAATDYIKSFADQIRPFVPGALPGAGHRRLRPVRLPPEPAPLLRGRPPLRHPSRAEALAEDGGVDPRLPSRTRSHDTGSIPASQIPCTV